MKPSGGAGVNAELIRSTSDTNVGSLESSCPSQYARQASSHAPSLWPHRTAWARTSHRIWKASDRTKRLQRLRGCTRRLVKFQARETRRTGSSVASVHLVSRNIDTSHIGSQARERQRRSAISAAQIQNLQGGAMPRDSTTASPECRMKAAISVKSPFSHNALFGFIFSPCSFGSAHQELQLCDAIAG